MNYEQVARLAHQMNKAYCEALGDKSQMDWDDAPDWQKESAIKGVEFHMVNKNVAPEDSHNAWLKEKEANGWKYGPVKDPEKKTHPCMLSFVELPIEQRAKDHLFSAVCKHFKEEFCKP